MWVPYFYDDNNWRRCIMELSTWNGTPYRHMWNKKGRGADCTLFLATVLQEIGVLKNISYDYYPKDWHIHTNTELIRNKIASHLKSNSVDGIEMVESINKDFFVRGDLISFSTTKKNLTNHVAMWIGNNRMYNSINNRGVCKIKYGSWWMKRFKSLLRPMIEV
jgi:cell wall-associated NlpC family hydrolase